MTPASIQASARLVPVRPLRAGMLAYIAALAAIEVTAGVVVAFAWREQSTRAVVGQTELQQLGELFDNLRIVEAVVLAGAVITTLLWSFSIVRNASVACRNGRSGAAAVISWALVPVFVLVLAQHHHSHSPSLVTVGVLIAQGAVMYLPFGTIATASKRVGGTSLPFVRWYVALTLTFLVHEAFTGSFNLAEAKPSGDLGRAAALMIASAVVLGLMVRMAGDASQSMEDATEREMTEHRWWRKEAVERFKAIVQAERQQPRQLPPPLPDARGRVLVSVGVAPVAVAATAVVARPLPPPPMPVAAPSVVSVVPSVEAVVPSVPPSVEAPVEAVVPAHASAPEPVAEAAPEPAPAPAGGSMFAPLAPRTTPRSL